MISAELLHRFHPFKRRYRVLVVGDLMLDHYIWGDTRRISPEAPVPVVSVNKESLSAGGAGNVAVNLARLGVACEVCGFVGTDVPGRQLVELLREEGIDHDARFQRAGAATIRKTRIVVRRQQICRVDHEGPAETYRIRVDEEGDFLRAACDRADAVIVCDYAKGGLTSELVEALTQRIHARGGLIAVDPKPANAIAMRDMDVLTPNRPESYELAGLPAAESGADYPAEEICRRIHERFAPRHLVITLGEDGILYAREGQVVLQVPTRARELFDVSGAGDTVVAALVVGLLAGMDHAAAIAFANCAAGVVVGKLGTATASWKEIEEFLEKA